MKKKILADFQICISAPLITTNLFVRVMFDILSPLITTNLFIRVMFEILSALITTSLFVRVMFEILSAFSNLINVRFSSGFLLRVS